VGKKGHLPSPEKKYNARFVSVITFWFVQKEQDTFYWLKIKTYPNCDCSALDSTGGAYSAPLDILAGFNPLECRANYIATSNNMKLVHWPLMGGLLHLVQRGGDWAGPQPAMAPPSCTKCNSPPINGQCTNHRIAV